MKEYDLASLAQASDKDLVEFLGQNEKVIGEVTAHIANLERLKGTSQAHALGYQEYLPDEITMQDFDTHLSKKGYQMSTEALHTILLVAASAAVIAGIGIIAYKLIKASMAKEPKSADFLKKQKEVRQFAMHLVKINWSEAKPETVKVLKERFLADCVSEVTANMSEADLLNDTFNAYVRSEFRTQGVPYMTLAAAMRGPASVFSSAATIYLTNVKESLEAFRREFLDVISGAPDITDHQMINLVNGLKWNQIDNGNAAGVQALMSWINAMGIPSSNKLEEALRNANDILAAPASLDQIMAYDQSHQDELIGEGTVPKAIALLQSLKATGKYIEGAKGNFTAGEKRSQQVVDLFKQQIERAQLLADTIPLISPLVTLESDNVVRRSKAIANAGKRLLNAIDDVAAKLEDKEEAKRIHEALDEVAKVYKSTLKMKTESLDDNFPARVSFGSMMDLQAKSPWMELLKSLAVVALIGLAAYALQAVVLSMLGLQSMAASFAGGIVYFNKSGKRITPGEAADAIAKSAQEKRVGKYGATMVTGQHNLPFILNRNHLDSGFKTVAEGVYKSLTEFASELPRSGVTSEDMIKACEAGSKHIKRTASILEGRLKDMKVKIPGGDPSVKATTHNLRDAMDAFNEEWFNAEKADYGIIRKGIDTSWFGVMDAQMADHVEKNAKDLTDGITRFAKSIPNATKEELQKLSPEAQEAHASFMQSQAYLATLGFVITEITKKAIADGGKGMQCVKDNLKMRGESMDDFEGSDDFGGDGVVQYQEDLDPLIDVADAMDDLYVDEQSDAVMAMEKMSVRTKRLLMTAGIVIALGAGAYLLLSMSQNRRSPSSFATDKLFKQIQKDLEAGLASEEFAAQMKASGEEFADALQRDFDQARKAAEQQQRANAQPREKEVNGQRVDAGAAQPASVNPRIGETGSPVSGRNYASTESPESRGNNLSLLSMQEIAKLVDDMIADIGRFEYREPLRLELIKRTPPLCALNMSVGAPAEADGIVEKDRVHRLEKMTALMQKIMDNIVDPVFDAIKTHRHEEASEKAIDEVVKWIVDISREIEQEGFNNDAVIDDINATIEASSRPCTEDEVNEAIKRFDKGLVRSAEYKYMGETKSYNSMISDLDAMINENSNFLNKDMADRFNELKGNRDWTSKLIRRVEEFKPMFNAVARQMKAQVAFSEMIFGATEFTLRIHRHVQRDLIRQIRAQQFKAEELKARMNGESKALGKMSDDLKGILSKFEGYDVDDK